MAGFALDDRLGIDGFLSPAARRLLCLAGASWSFAQAARHLHAFCGLVTNDEVIRQACHQEATAVAAWRTSDPQAVADFVAAAGDIEFQTDAAKVNTTGGWRDMKLGIFAKRGRGQPAAPEDWDDRVLPVPQARMAFAAIQTSQEFGPRGGEWAARLGIEEPSQITILGDGADWIWSEAKEQLPEAKRLLDIYHGAEHLADAAKAVYGEGSAAARAWLARGRLALLRDGWWGLCDHVGETLTEAAVHADAKKRKALEGLVGYFSKHTEHVGYCLRLRRGQSIGSGMVEGAAKNLVGRRMKQTGARWEVDRVNRMAELCCTLYSDCWDKYWERN